MMSKAEEYKLELLDVIKDNKIAFLDHAFFFTSFSRLTACHMGLHKLDDVRDALRKNRWPMNLKLYEKMKDEYQIKKRY